jgi:molybdate transport system substrate-binding protein
LKRSLFIIIVLFFLFVSPASALDKLHIAVAANFISPFKELTQAFEKQTGIKVEATYASTGQLYTQIVNGAPYDLFLSADQEKPDLLFKEGKAEAPFVYATGRVVLWTMRKDYCQAKNWREIMAAPGLKKVSIANPKTAPYGAAAMEAMNKAGIPANAKEKLVFAQNIAQAFQYAATGSVDAGFCALSAASSAEGRKGCFFPVDEAPPIVQGACLLKRTLQADAAGKFAGFLASPEAQAVNKKYGYK